MTTRTAHKDLTAQDIEAGYHNDAWLGFGYLGVRKHYLADGEAGGWPDTARTVAETDQAILAIANEKRWTPEQLFDWCNSKLGRWYADETLGGYTPDVDAVAGKYVKRPY